MSRYARLMAQLLGLPTDQVEAITAAAPLHDAPLAVVRTPAAGALGSMCRPSTCEAWGRRSDSLTTNGDVSPGEPHGNDPGLGGWQRPGSRGDRRA